MDKNTYGSKCKRFFSAFLPISENRTGKCIRCGNCCKLPKPCIFLKENKNEKDVCLIYAVRPLNCRKYPRVEEEQITKKTCRFQFK